jgi:hypothetical protein
MATAGAGLRRFGHLAGDCCGRDDRVVKRSEPEPLIVRDEVVARLFNIAEVAAAAQLIRELIEEDGEAEED